jgi:hypothetical protein
VAGTTATITIMAETTATVTITAIGKVCVSREIQNVSG